MQEETEVVQLAPGHRGDGPPHELLVGPGEVRARRIIQLRRRAVAAVQLRRELAGAAQALVHLAEPPFLRRRAGPPEDGDQIEVAAARLVITASE